MRILHTSDWHLGRTLYGRKRYDEFSAFLDWLTQILQNEKIDVLLVAGDVFDTSTPSNHAQALYYQFLCRVASTFCRHVVVIAGNHDSPSFLNAPKELLRAINIYVVGAVTDSLADEVILLQTNNQPEAIICAVPYLRDKDIRTVCPGETMDDKNTKLVEGLRKHYAAVADIAINVRNELLANGQPLVPIIGMGHLFTAGGRTLDGDGVRELYVGSLAHVEKEIFPSIMDYLALGHLHVPQSVGGAAHIRYSGSPIPMGYGEATQEKKVVLINFESNKPLITELSVPCFQKLVRIVGSVDVIQAQLQALKEEKSTAWLEIEYQGSDATANLNEIFTEIVNNSAMELRRIKNRRAINQVVNKMHDNETLDDLDNQEIFTRCLDAYDVADEERQALRASYQEIIKSLDEEDVNAQ